MKYLGIDYGAKRVGIALSDDGGKMAFPHATLSNDGTLLEEVTRICHEFNVGTIIVGESRQLNGEPNQIQKAIERFCEKIKNSLNLPVIFEPEFMTSRQASHIQGETEMIDASAATIILQSFIDRPPKLEPINVKTPLITFDDFSKVELRVGKVLSAEKILNTDKLLKLSVDLGEPQPRQVVSGIALAFPDSTELVGKKFTFVTNLEPRKIKGFESQAMILATGDAETFSLFSPTKDAPPGSVAR